MTNEAEGGVGFGDAETGCETTADDEFLSTGEASAKAAPMGTPPALVGTEQRAEAASVGDTTGFALAGAMISVVRVLAGAPCSTFSAIIILMSVSGVYKVWSLTSRSENVCA